jgi:hypothetical protein
VVRRRRSWLESSCGAADTHGRFSGHRARVFLGEAKRDLEDDAYPAVFHIFEPQLVLREQVPEPLVRIGQADALLRP